MEISPLSGPSLYVSPLTMNYPGTSSPLVGGTSSPLVGGSDNTETPKSLSNDSPLPGGTTSAKSTMSLVGDTTPDMGVFWDNILVSGENPDGRRNSWDAGSSNTTTPVDTSVIAKKDGLSSIKKEDTSQVKGPEDMTKTLETLDERRSKRLERNRMSARMSRRRKKKLLEELTEKVKNTMNELSHLRQMCLRMMLKAHAKDSALLSTYRTRAGLANYFDKAYFEHMLPIHTKFLLWLTVHMWRDTKQQEFRSDVTAENMETTNPAGVWKLICNELSLTETQRKKIMTHVHSNATEKSGTELRRMLSCNQFIRTLRYHLRHSSERVQMIRQKMDSLLNEKQKQVIRKSVNKNVGSTSQVRQYYKSQWVPKSLDFYSDAELQKVKQILEKPNEQIRSSELNFLVTFLTKKAGSNPKAVRGNERKYSMESTC